MPDLSHSIVCKGISSGSQALSCRLGRCSTLVQELVFRGYLMNRVAGLFAGPRAGWTVALVMADLFCVRTFYIFIKDQRESSRYLLKGVVYGRST